MSDEIQLMILGARERLECSINPPLWRCLFMLLLCGWLAIRCHAMCYVRRPGNVM